MQGEGDINIRVHGIVGFMDFEWGVGFPKGGEDEEGFIAVLKLFNVLACFKSAPGGVGVLSFNEGAVGVGAFGDLLAFFKLALGGGAVIFLRLWIVFVIPFSVGGVFVGFGYAVVEFEDVEAGALDFLGGGGKIVVEVCFAYEGCGVSGFLQVGREKAF